MRINSIEAELAKRRLDDLARAARGTEQQTERLGRTSARTSRTAAAMNVAWQGTIRTLGAIRLAIGGTMRAFGNLLRTLVSFRALLSGIAAAFVVRGLIAYADAWQNVTNRLAAFVKEGDQVVALQEEIFQIAQRSRTPLEDVSNLYARLVINQKEVGASTRELLSFTEAVGQSIILSGSTAAEASGALRQLSQLVANRQIRAAGQELQSIREQAPFLFSAILQGMELTEREFRDLAEQGKLTSKQIIDAMNSMAETIQERFDRITPTIGQSFTVLRNSILRTIGVLSQASGFGETLSRTIIRIARSLDDLADIAANAQVSIERVIQSTGAVELSNIGREAIRTIVGELRSAIGPALIEILVNAAVFFAASMVRAIRVVVPAMIDIVVGVATAFANAVVKAFEAQAPRLARFFGVTEGASTEDIATGLINSLDQAAATVQSTAATQVGKSIEDIRSSLSRVAGILAILADRAREARSQLQDMGGHPSGPEQITAEAQQALDAIRRLNSALDFEISLIGKTNDERERAEELAKARQHLMNLDIELLRRIHTEVLAVNANPLEIIDPERAALIDAILERIVEKMEKIKEAQELREFADDIGREFGDLATNIAFEFDKIEETFEQFIRNISRLVFEELVSKKIAEFVSGLIVSAFSGGGLPNTSSTSGHGGFSGAGQFGGVGGGGVRARAHGGSVEPFRVYRVGEVGPELFMSRTPGTVIPNHQIGSQMGSVHNEVNIHYYERGRDSFRRNRSQLVAAGSDMLRGIG